MWHDGSREALSHLAGGWHGALVILVRVLAEWLTSVGRGRVLSWSAVVSFQGLPNLRIPLFSGPDSCVLLNVNGMEILDPRRQRLAKSLSQAKFTIKSNGQATSCLTVGASSIA